jgi:ATPase family associated with various cellular activities (AAA)
MTQELHPVVEWARGVVRNGIKSPAPVCPIVDSIASLFALTKFESSVLALATSIEIDSSLIDDLPGTQLKVSYLLDRLEEPHWSAFAASSTLRRWDLIHVDASNNFSQSPIRIDESVLQALLGFYGPDEYLLQFIEPEHSEVFTNTRLTNLTQNLTDCWRGTANGVNLYGADSEPIAWMFHAASHELQLIPWRLDATLIPETIDGRFKLATHWTRFAAIHGTSLLISAKEMNPNVRLFATQLRTPYVVATEERIDLKGVEHYEVTPASTQERSEYWMSSLGDNLGQMNGKLRMMVEQFDVPPARLAEVVRRASADPENFESAMWMEAKSASRRKLDELAQRIDPVATWDDLVLSADQQAVLKELVSQVRTRAVVHEDWGFGDRIARGLGIAALFHGASGTGKTLSAEVVANELGLDLFRIDLSTVVSKYIGDTEKNLKKIFDAAEKCGAVLLFDEADALFGKRTEVKDSHDRYANIEVGYLLQRMESYRGIAILTTNMKDSFDPAFLRRLRFIVSFPFPGVDERKEIWRKSIPAKAPIKDINFDNLAKLNISGGHIRNIALSAAFLAADEGSEITMSHFQAAAKTEYLKLDRPFSKAEVF